MGGVRGSWGDGPKALLYLGVSADSKTLPKCSDCTSAKNPDLTSYLMPDALHWHCIPIGVGEEGENRESTVRQSWT